MRFSEIPIGARYTVALKDFGYPLIGIVFTKLSDTTYKQTRTLSRPSNLDWLGSDEELGFDKPQKFVEDHLKPQQFVLSETGYLRVPNGLRIVNGKWVKTSDRHRGS